MKQKYQVPKKHSNVVYGVPETPGCFASTLLIKRLQSRVPFQVKFTQNLCVFCKIVELSAILRGEWLQVKLT